MRGRKEGIATSASFLSHEGLGSRCLEQRFTEGEGLLEVEDDAKDAEASDDLLIEKPCLHVGSDCQHSFHLQSLSRRLGSKKPHASRQ